MAPNVTPLYEVLGPEMIRLIDLSPGNARNPVHITLRITDNWRSIWRHVYGREKAVLMGEEAAGLDAYEALSYTWGARNEDRFVIANKQHRVPVTDNLYNALRRLRQRRSSRTLWADQLCINQSDDLEKSRQVAMMSDIYGCADCVNVWLGEPGRISLLDLYPIQHVFPTSFKVRQHLRYVRWAANTFGSPFPKHMRRHALAVERAIARTAPRWQDRAWIIQEFAMAHEVWFYCGALRLQIDSGLVMRWAVLALSKGFTSLPQHLGEFSRRLGELERVRMMKYRGPHPPGDEPRYTWLLSMVHTLGPAQAKDVRDRVYSLLGLLNEQQAKLIGNSYAVPASEVFARATFSCIEAWSDITIFNLVALDDAHRLAGLPSWAIDFSRLQRFGEEHSELQDMRRQPCRKDGFVKLDIFNKLLTIRGFFVHVVTDDNLSHETARPSICESNLSEAAIAAWRQGCELCIASSWHHLLDKEALHAYIVIALQRMPNGHYQYKGLVQLFYNLIELELWTDLDHHMVALVDAYIQGHAVEEDVVLE